MQRPRSRKRQLSFERKGPLYRVPNLRTLIKKLMLVKPKLIEKESANEQENGCANAQRLSRKLLNPLLCSFRAQAYVCLVSKLELRERSYIRRYL